jgi:folate-binding protein YgfZ
VSDSFIESIGDFEAEYSALTQRCGLADWRDRTLIELTGADRANFLHNFSTNDINKLGPGQGCELFITDIKGKTLGHGSVLCRTESLVLETTAGQAEKLIAHLDRYLLREQVTLEDRSQQWTQLLLAGPQAADVIQSQFEIDLPQQPLDHAKLEIASDTLNIYGTDSCGPAGFCLWGTPDAVHRAALRLANNAVVCGPQAVNTVRLEAGTPWYGVDITDDNLPQEVGRNERAISFSKGCYLGQETVARIDALGHVNRTLCGLRFASPEVPATGTQLNRQGNSVGWVTSAAFSPRLSSPLALAYIRRGHEQPRTKLDSDSGPAEVVSLPLGAASQGMR